VERLNDEKDKAILSLSEEEFSRVHLSQRVKILIFKPYLRLNGIISKVTPGKKTVVVSLDKPEEALGARVHGSFQTLFINRLQPRVLPARSQWYQNAQSSVESSVGGVGEYGVETIAGDRKRSYLAGTRVGIAGQVVFKPEVVGLGVSYDETRLRGRVRLGEKTKVGLNAKVHQFEPGGWYQVEPGWKVGLALKHTTFDHIYSGASFDQYYVLDQPILSLTYTDGTAEWTWSYESKDESKASATKRTSTAGSESILYKAPARLMMTYRQVDSAQWTWAVGGGYIFYERSQGKGEALRPRATIDEKILLYAALELTEDDGAKWDWTLSYSGARDIYQSMREQGANMAKMRLNYQAPPREAWVYGGAIDLWAGKSAFEDQQVNTSTKVTETSLRTVIGAQMSAEVFIQYQADLLSSERRLSRR
jgi:hypothetical protein